MRVQKYTIYGRGKTRTPGAENWKIKKKKKLTDFSRPPPADNNVYGLRVRVLHVLLNLDGISDVCILCDYNIRCTPYTMHVIIPFAHACSFESTALRTDCVPRYDHYRRIRSAGFTPPRISY